jgi:hypothetical protein
MTRCEGCKLVQTGLKYRVCIPPPSGAISGFIISRDPTTEFLVPLKDYQQQPVDNRGLLGLDAPPLWLYNKISKFLNNSEYSDNDLFRLQNFFNHQCYWTHLHKCPTCKAVKPPEQNTPGSKDKSEFFPSFRYSAGKSCADRWFESEFEKFGTTARIIITCGRDVEKYFRSWSKQHLRENDAAVIHLPHPSGANCGNGWSWNKNSNQRELIKTEIFRLMELI